jgi:hypothetical protein
MKTRVYMFVLVPPGKSICDVLWISAQIPIQFAT